MMSITHSAAADEVRPSALSGMEFAVGFFLSFRLFIMLLSVRILGTEPETGVEAGLALNFLLVPVLAFCSIGESRYTLRQMLRLPPVRWAFAFLAFSGLSLFWSSTASLSAAAAFWCAMAADVCMVVLLLRAGRLRETAACIMKGFVCGACAVAVIAWILPAQSDLRLGDEELLGPNQIGYLCAFAIFFAQYLMREKNENWSLAVLLLAVTLLRSLSKTTIAAFLISQAFLLLRDSSIRLKTRMLLALAAAAITAVFASLLASYYDVYTNAGNQSETLTGRLGIWAYLLSEAIEQPWIGHGFHSVWKVIPPFGPELFEARHAHNELLQQFYAYGAAGILLFLGIYTSLYLEIRKIAKGPRRTFLLAFLIFVLIRGLADTEPFDLSFPLWAVMLFSPLLLQAQQEKSIASQTIVTRL
jgi:O-antigen ligase